MKEKKMNNKIIREIYLPVIQGFLVNNGSSLATYCDACNEWHSYNVNNDVKQGYRTTCLSECDNKKSCLYKKVIRIQRVPKILTTKDTIYITMNELLNYYNDRKYL